MSPEAQRAAIAEAAGWSYHGPADMKHGAVFCWTRHGREYNPMRSISLPDYLNDLNAMAEAVGLLSDGEKESYREELADLIHLQTGLAWCDAATAAIDASASQRAEALLKSTGNWDDAK